jgi:serine phosphatase RsbU (regulator of sigma subunit)
MSVPFSLDDVARTSDDAAVRARFDASCLEFLRIAGIVFFVIGLVHTTQADTSFRTILGAISSVTGGLTFVLVRKRAVNFVARFVQRRARATSIAFLVLQAAALIVFHADANNEEAFVFAIMIPIIAVFFRLLPSEHVLLHTLVAVIAIAVVVTMPIGQKHPQELIPVLINDAICLGIALFLSRRRRRGIVAEWTERRTSAREQIRMRDELMYARELQLSMLPECAPSLAWADICSASIPATEVGGDYFDYFVDGDCVALICLDVAGHGMASGLVVSAVRGGLTVLRDSLREPAAVLRRLHDLVTHTTQRRMLVTISIVLLDHKARRATVASAGHPPVLVRRANGSVESLSIFAPPLGVRLPMQITQRTFDFDSGDVFVLHSDGIYEARNALDDSYGLERLQDVVAEHGGGSAEALRDAVLADVATFRGMAEQQDDVTVVICRIG